VKKYVGYSIIISLPILAVTTAHPDYDLSLGLFWKSFFLGGTFGVFILYKYFSRRNYWVLFSNLKINNYFYLGLSYFIYQVILLTIIFTVWASVDGF